MPLFEPAIDEAWREEVAQYFRWSERLDRQARRLATHFHRSKVAARRLLAAEGIPLDDFNYVGSLPPGARLLRHALRQNWKNIDLKTLKEAQVVSRKGPRPEGSGTVPAAAVTRTFVLRSFIVATIAGQPERVYSKFSVHERYVRLTDTELTLLHIYIFDNNEGFWLPSPATGDCTPESLVKKATWPMWKARERMDRSGPRRPRDPATWSRTGGVPLEESPWVARFSTRLEDQKYRRWTPPDISWRASQM